METFFKFGNYAFITKMVNWIKTQNSNYFDVKITSCAFRGVILKTSLGGREERPENPMEFGVKPSGGQAFLPALGALLYSRNKSPFSLSYSEWISISYI